MRRHADGRGSDVVRQGLNVFGAVLQVVAGFGAGSAMSDIANEFRTTILPAGYAFTIWSLIFTLFAIYAIYQALPQNRADPLLRRVGWFTAAATIGNGVWEVVFPLRWFAAAQVLIVLIAVAAGFAFFRFVATVRGRAETTFERWVVGPALGLLFGWLTAASVVGFAATLATFGVDRDGIAAAVGGGALLLAGGFIAFLVIVAARRGTAAEAWVAYGAAVVWAFVAIVVNQLGANPVSTAAAVVAAVLVLLAMVLPATGSTRRQRSASGLGSPA